MFSCSVVNRLLDILKNRPDRKVKTAIYITNSADIDGLGKYIFKYLNDESYISNGGYMLDYDRTDVYVESADTFEMFKHVIAQNYEMVFMLTGDDENKLLEIVHSLSSANNMIFMPMDCKLRAYRMLDERQLRRLKRKAR